MEQNDSPIETLLETLPPETTPRLGKRLASAPWTPRVVRRNRILAVINMAILLFVAAIVLTPQGRAFAQSIFQFFITTDQTSISISQEEIDFYYTPFPTHALSLVNVTPISPTPSPCLNSEGEGTYVCEIQKVEKQLNMDLKEFSALPSVWAFRGVNPFSTDPVTKMNNAAEIWYEVSGGYLFLTQGNGEFSPGMTVLSSAVEQIRIGKYYGEYVDGSFGVKNGDTKLTWDSVGADQRIRWKEGERWFEILELSGPGTSGFMDKQTLISLATHMIYQPDKKEEAVKINPNFIPNISLAEKICGYSISQPTRLPIRMELDYVRYDDKQKSITLNYGSRALRIVQGPKETSFFTNLDSYKDVETVQISNMTGQYGISPLQKTIWDSATPPAYPVTNTYSILLWEKDGMIYQIYFDQSYSGGGQLTKEQMIEIAESLR